MKKLITLSVPIIIVFIITGCISTPEWTTMYKAIDKDQFSQFDCAYRNQITDSLIIITTDDIKECFFKDTSKITWLLFIHIDCLNNPAYQASQLFKQYTDDINFVIICDDYSILSVKEEMNRISHLIYFIDPVYSNSRTKNTRLFISNLFNDEVGRNFASNIISYKGEILEMVWDVDSEMLENVMNQLNP